MHASRIIHWYLKQERDPEKRGQILKEAMRATTGLYLPTMQTSFENRKQEDQEDADAFIVTEDDFKEMQRNCVEKIIQNAESGALKSHLNMVEILYWWREWTSSEEPKKWVDALIESQDGLLFFLTAFLRPSTSQTVGDHVSRIHWHISLKSIEDFISVEVLAEKVGLLALEDLGEKEQRAIRAFQKALKRKQEGKSDDFWRDDEDE